MWKALTDDQKRVYEEKANNDKLRYAEEMKVFRGLPPGSNTPQPSQPIKQEVHVVSTSQPQQHQVQQPQLQHQQPQMVVIQHQPQQQQQQGQQQQQQQQQMQQMHVQMLSQPGEM
jgi:hypothetical protein